ncbi:hypothetical protein PRIPAC_90643 [Pristionchus pacificus]|uniref:Uncharacterized protein n=1 Tax=Pristionchus pacificus TaxID=54126 RepID=A0A2A6B6E5_PRIPA|nr:hypothetical protein PRIPAC_90643 [Pristionchus pacificus]|eukprot:PDM61460.1 hypothetical protein PRIPAC_50902 [Pristionchus pacificus]
MSSYDFTTCGIHAKAVMRSFFIIRLISVIAVLFFCYYLQFKGIPHFAIAGIIVNIIITIPLSIAVFMPNRACVILYVILEFIFHFFWLFPFYSSGVIIFDLLQSLRLDFGLPDPSLGLIMTPILLFFYVIFIIKVLLPFYEYVGTVKREERLSKERELHDIPLLH